MKCNKETTSPIELLNFIKMCAKGGTNQKRRDNERKRVRIKMAARLNLEPSWAQGLKLKLKTQVARMRGASGQAAELTVLTLNSPRQLNQAPLAIL